MTQSRQLAAIMFTDIVGYTALMDEDEQKAFELLRKNRQVQKPIIEKFNGRWLKEMGDGVLASFATVTDAVYCAKEIQKICQDDPQLNLRIGIHEGEVVFDGEDVFGSGVNIASRLEPLAPTGGILVSESVHRNLGNKTNIVSTFVGEEQLKYVKEPIRIYSVKVEGAGPVVIAQTSDTGRQLSSKSGNPGKMALAVGGVLIFLLLSYFFYSNFTTGLHQLKPQATFLDKSIVVLPFTNLSSDPEQEYFSDGMMEEILNHLVKIEDLKVVSRTTAMRYKGTTKSVSEITKELNVATALEGSVRKDGDQVRITVLLVEGDTDMHLWSESYDRELTSIFQVQSSVAKQIARVLQAEITPEVKLSIENQSTKNIEAYNLLLESNFISRQPGSEKKQRDLLEKAVALDSTNARIWAGLAEAYARWGGDYILRHERALKAREAAEKAIFLDPNEGMGYAELGRILRIYYWDWEGAAIALTKAEHLSSEYTGSLIGLYQSLGQWDKCIAAGMSFLEQEPINPNRYWVVGHNYLLADIPNKAIVYLKRALELDPNYEQARIDLGWAYLEANIASKAIEVLNQVNNKKHGRYISYLVQYYYQSKMLSEAKMYLGQLLQGDGHVDNSIYIARSYAIMGEYDRCFEWLQTAYERKNPALCLIKGALFKHVQNSHDLRYNELLISMNLTID